jgi:hypothetical protein
VFGNCCTKFTSFSHLVITADDDVLVADHRNNVVAVFDSGGVASNIVHSLKVNSPLGLAIDCDGDTKLV